ncbi:radical SAM protein [Sorangium sp. So ce1097]|uniref:radical SAM protein n=1 Tax=Sorangium sp. So ce1097 TaxID=3133330 RepID=UPI003F63735B
MTAKLPLVDRRFTFTPSAKDREVFHSFSRGLCPQCKRAVDGVRILRDGKVYLRKQCPTHGQSEALISGDADWFLRSLTYVKEGSRPLEYSTPVERGCPDDCGLCPDHEQHSCLPIIEITNHCNLECPICIVQNRHNYNMTREEFGRVLDGIVAKEGALETINLSGGEPTLHPEFLELLDMARARTEIARVSISTNGLRCASDYAFCEELARRKVYVSLQLDALSNPALRVLRGGGDQAAAREKALANLKKAGVRTTLVSTVARGVNDDRIGDCIRLLYENDFILSLTFQPAAYTGYGGAHFAPHDPLDVMTIPDVVRAAEEQTGLLRKSDFLPLPCSHPSCFALTYLLKVDGEFIPFPRFLELDRYLELLANRGTIRPDEEFEGALRDAIDQMWTSAGQVPDCDRILKVLRRAIFLMYPEERALALEERLHIGEGLVKTVFIHAFMDVHTFEVDRIKKCCTHYALPDGRLMPGCAYNNLYRDRDPRFAGPVGAPQIWGKT